MSTLPPSPAPAVAAPQPRGNTAFYYLLYLLLLAIPTAALAWMLFDWVPRFRAVFRDSRTPLPTLTTWLFGLGDFVRAPWVIVTGIVVVCLLPLIPAWITARPRRSGARAFTLFLLVILLLSASLAVLYVMQTALFVPLFKILDAAATQPEH